jgi:hypothetical protein
MGSLGVLRVVREKVKDCRTPSEVRLRRVNDDIAFEAWNPDQRGNLYDKHRKPTIVIAVLRIS